MSEGARQSLSRKRQHMSDFHKENLQYHGLAPTAAEETPPLPDGRDVPVPMDEDDVQMTVPGSQPPPPPQGPSRRFPQNRLQPHSGPAQASVDGPSFPGLPPGPGGPPGRFSYTSKVPIDTDVAMVNRYNIGEDDAVTVQGSLGKPPDFPGSGAAALRNREYFRTPQTGPGGLPDVANPILSDGGGPPPPPAAGAVLIPHYAAGPDPAEMQVYHSPGDAPGPALPGARIRATPYDRKRIIGKQPALRDEFFAEGMDTAPSAPAAIVPMEEQNTGVKRGKEEEPKPKKKAAKPKKKKDEVVVAQSPPSMPPPPPGGAAALKASREVPEPAEEPASGSAVNAPTSVPYYPKSAGAGKARKAAPQAVIDDLPSVPTKRGAEKPLEDGTPAVLRPDTQRRRAPAPEPDSEPSPLNPSSSSSSSSRRLAIGNQRVW